MPTKEELLQQLAALDEEEKKLKEAQVKYSLPKGRKGSLEKTKMYNGTKGAIIAIVIFFAVIGTLGSMKIGPFSNFDMDSFTSFLKTYSPIFITLTGSIGVGGIAKNILKSKNGGTVSEDGESVAADPEPGAVTGSRSTGSKATMSAAEDLVKRGRSG